MSGGRTASEAMRAPAAHPSPAPAYRVFRFRCEDKKTGPSSRSRTTLRTCPIRTTLLLLRALLLGSLLLHGHSRITSLRVSRKLGVFSSRRDNQAAASSRPSGAGSLDPASNSSMAEGVPGRCNPSRIDSQLVVKTRSLPRKKFRPRDRRREIASRAALLTVQFVGDYRKATRQLIVATLIGGHCPLLLGIKKLDD